MIKIEYFVDENTAGYLVRNKQESTLFPGMILDEDDLDTLKVTSGAICVSIDELEAYYIDAKGNRTLVYPVANTLVEEVLSPVADTAVVAEAAPAEAVTEVVLEAAPVTETTAETQAAE